MKYYIAIDNQPEGPYEHHELLIHGLTPTSLVWTEGMTDWAEARTVPEMQALLSGDPSAAPQPDTATATPPPPYSGWTRQEQAPRYAPGMTGTGQQYPLMPCPKTWLVESILVTVFCCLPFGVVGIVKSSNVESYWRQGMYAEAEAASRSAGFWTKLGFFSVLGIGLIYLGIACLGTFGAIGLL